MLQISSEIARPSLDLEGEILASCVPGHLCIRVSKRISHIRASKLDDNLGKMSVPGHFHSL